MQGFSHATRPYLRLIHYYTVCRVIFSGRERVARAMCGNPYYFLENDLYIWENRLIFAAGSILYLGLIHGKTISNHGKNGIIWSERFGKILRVTRAFTKSATMGELRGLRELLVISLEE